MTTISALEYALEHVLSTEQSDRIPASKDDPMRALRFQQPGPDSTTTQIVDLQPPNADPGEVVIQVEAAGVNYIDVMARRGDPGYTDTWPWTPGFEVAGRVLELGTGVEGFNVGDRVAAFTFGGGVAEITVAPAALTALIPSGLDPLLAATAPLTLSTAVLLLTGAARIGPGDRVVMYAASGGLGRYIARLLPQLQAEPTVGIVGSFSRIDDALSAGWKNAVTLGDPNWKRHIREVLPQGADIILDPLGTAQLTSDVELARAGGRVVLFGNADGGAFDPLPPLPTLLTQNLALSGFSIRSLASRRPDDVRRAFSRALHAIADGRLTIDQPISVPLEETPAVHDLLAAGKSAGKYVTVLR
jgi:NADPH2:quinone reductase